MSAPAGVRAMWEMIAAGAVALTVVTFDEGRSTIDGSRTVTTANRFSSAVDLPLLTVDGLSPTVDRPTSNVDREARSPALTAMYVTFGALQVADFHSTSRALAKGAVERNPAMRAVVGNRAAFIAVKAAGGATTIVVSEKLRKKHPIGAFVLMASLNTFLATVVAHNYRLR